MAQKVNEAKVIELLKEGFNTAQIAKEHWEEIRLNPNDQSGITRQNISWIRKEAEKRGEVFPKTQRGRPVGVVKQPTDGELNFEQVSETIIKAFEQSAKVPELEAELNRVRNRLAIRETELKELDKKKDQERRFKLAQQQGIIGGGK